MRDPGEVRNGVRSAYLTALLLAGGLAFGGGPAPATDQPVAELEAAEDGLSWSPKVDYQRLVLTVTGPGVDLQRGFEPKQRPRLAFTDENGKRLPDGAYTWELRVTPKVSPQVREKLAASREATDRLVPMDHGRMEGLPKGPFVQSGHFMIQRGQLLRPKEVELPREKQDRPKPRQEVEGDLRIAGDLEVSGAKKFVVPDPQRPDRVLYYAALEGPEAGTYFRGTARIADGRAVIDLPEHFAKLTEPGGLTVQLTPLGSWTQLYVAEKSTRRLVVIEAEGRSGIEFDFLIQGVRKGYADFRVERSVTTPEGR